MSVYAESRAVPGGAELVGTAVARVVGTELAHAGRPGE